MQSCTRRAGPNFHPPCVLQRPSTLCSRWRGRAASDRRMCGSRTTVGGRRHACAPLSDAAVKRAWHRTPPAVNSQAPCAPLPHAHAPFPPSHAGGARSERAASSLSPDDRRDLARAEALALRHNGTARQRPAIVVCHSMPYFYATPQAAWGAGAECPPNNTGANVLRLCMRVCTCMTTGSSTHPTTQPPCSFPLRAGHRPNNV
jgi:hypothetical protein